MRYCQSGEVTGETFHAPGFEADRLQVKEFASLRHCGPAEIPRLKFLLLLIKLHGTLLGRYRYDHVQGFVGPHSVFSSKSPIHCYSDGLSLTSLN